MTNTPTHVEINCETNEVIERPLTAEEIAQQEADLAASAAQRAEEEAAAQALTDPKASARAKPVAGTPLTEEEAATLVI